MWSHPLESLIPSLSPTVSLCSLLCSFFLLTALTLLSHSQQAVAKDNAITRFMFMNAIKLFLTACITLLTLLTLPTPTPRTQRRFVLFRKVSVIDLNKKKSGLRGSSYLKLEIKLNSTNR